MTVAELDSRRAWSVAVAGAVASGTTFGTVYTFGAFFDAMVDDLAAGRGSIAGGWFVRRRALAMGVVATGNGIGTLVLVPLAERFIDAYGWRTAYLAVAAVDVPPLVVAGLIVARPPLPRPPPALARMREVWATTAFRVLFVTGVLFSVSLFIAFAFVVDFATEEGVSSSGAALLVGIIGGASVVGRLGLTGLAGRLPAVRLLQLCLAAQPVAFAVWLVAGGSYPALVVFALLLGVAYGGFVALGPEAAAVLFGVVGLGGVMALMFLVAGLGGLVGPPLAGRLSDVADGRVLPIAVTLGASTAAFVLSLFIPIRRPERLATDVEILSPRPRGGTRPSS